ncbi:MAG TPA: hypothetical protein VF077_05385 [Nitrospiraceae bacterium]
MILGSKTHTVGDTKLWRVTYDRWLDNTATITAATVVSSSTTCTVTTPTVLGREVTFYLNGGDPGETLTLSIRMTDSLGNIKNDTILFTVVAP